MARGIIYFLIGFVLFWTPLHSAIADPNECTKVAYELASQKYKPGTFPRILGVGFHSTEVAEFAPGSSSQVLALEEQLKNSGVSVIILKEPTAEDLQNLRPENGFYYGPLMVTWHKKAQTIEAEIQSIYGSAPGQGQKVADYNRKLKKTAGFNVSIEDRTSENYPEFLKLYTETTVNGKPMGVAAITHEYAPPPGAYNKLILIRDPNANNQLIAGQMIELFPDLQLGRFKGLAKIKSAGYNVSTEAYEKAKLAHRTEDEFRKLALAGGFEVFSFGSDPNFYGEMSGVGLVAHKFDTRFTPILGDMYPGALGQILKQKRIIKVLRPENFINPETGKPQYLFFAYAPNGDLVPHLFGEFSDKFSLKAVGELHP